MRSRRATAVGRLPGSTSTRSDPSLQELVAHPHGRAAMRRAAVAAVEAHERQRLAGAVGLQQAVPVEAGGGLQLDQPLGDPLLGRGGEAVEQPPGPPQLLEAVPAQRPADGVQQQGIRAELALDQR